MQVWDALKILDAADEKNPEASADLYVSSYKDQRPLTHAAAAIVCWAHVGPRCTHGVHRGLCCNQVAWYAMGPKLVYGLHCNDAHVRVLHHTYGYRAGSIGTRLYCMLLAPTGLRSTRGVPSPSPLQAMPKDGTVSDVATIIALSANADF